MKAASATAFGVIFLIFILDLFTPLGYSSWLLYSAPILILSSSFQQRKSVFLVMCLISVLIGLDFIFSPPGIRPLISTVNRLFGTSALWALAFMNFRRNRLERDLREQTSKLNSFVALVSESEKNLRTIFDSSYDAIFIHDVDGRIIDVNKKMLEMYGVDYKTTLSLSHVNDYSSAENPVHLLPEIWEKVRSGESLLFEWKAKKPGDGTTFDVEVFLRRIELNQKTAMLGTVRDISERKRAYEELEAKVGERTRELAETNRELRSEIMERSRAEEMIQKSKELSDSLNRLAIMIHSTLDFDQIMQRVVEEATTVLNSDATMIGLVEGDMFQIRYSHNLPESFTERKQADFKCIKGSLLCDPGHGCHCIQ